MLEFHTSSVASLIFRSVISIDVCICVHFGQIQWSLPRLEIGQTMSSPSNYLLVFGCLPFEVNNSILFKISSNYSPKSAPSHGGKL
jgi:hypothetical protein